MGVCGQRVFLTFGTGGSFGGWNDQNRFVPDSGLRTSDFPVLGSGAPRLTHAIKSAICSSLSLPPAFFGGICRSSFVQRIASISRLLSTSPATTAGLPDSPPLSIPSLLSSSKPPLTFSADALWHL